MPLIELTTHIHASIETCFDLSRSIDLHIISTSHTKEKAIAGVTSGLIGLDEYVTWEAVHFGIKQRLSSTITAYDRPYHFRDEQLKGPFLFLKHDHYFEQANDIVVMKDAFEFSSPYGIFGKLADAVLLKNYLKKLLVKRNAVIKAWAESGNWSEGLNQ